MIDLEGDGGLTVAREDTGNLKSKIIEKIHRPHLKK